MVLSIVEPTTEQKEALQVSFKSTEEKSEEKPIPLMELTQEKYGWVGHQFFP